MLHDVIKKEGVTLLLNKCSSAFWAAAPAADDEVTSVVDAVFVDDECIFLLGRTPKNINGRVDKVLRDPFRIFQLLRLLVNFKAGKIEAMVQ